MTSNVRPRIYFYIQGETVDGKTEDINNQDSFAAQLLKHGSNPNATEQDTGKYTALQKFLLHST